MRIKAPERIIFLILNSFISLIPMMVNIGIGMNKKYLTSLRSYDYKFATFHIGSFFERFSGCNYSGRHRGTKSKKVTTSTSCGLRRDFGVSSVERSVEPSGVLFDRVFCILNNSKPNKFCAFESE